MRPNKAFTLAKGWAAYLLAVALTLSTTTAQAADHGWAGAWDTQWRDGGARLTLQQQGNRVSGEYPAYGGRIEGEVDGRTLTGRWIEGGRSGGITFVLAGDSDSFMGRFDTGEWWTGGRAKPAFKTVQIDQAGPRQALRTFLLAGNSARNGAPDDWAKAAAVIEFGEAGAALAPGQKLAAARQLFTLVDQTTVPLWPIPGRRAEGDHLSLTLDQAGTAAHLPLDLVRGPDKLWRIAMPADLAPLRDALLARSGGREPPTGDVKLRRSARDAMRSFVDGFSDWDGTGRAQVLDALDLSIFSPATRAYEGELAATYLDELLDRIGTILPQEIPDDPQNRVPYVVFNHPAGNMVLVPTILGTGTDGGGWRFTAETVRSARDLYTAIEDMPEVDGGAVPDVPSNFMRIRRAVRDASPGLLTQVGGLELWQGLGVALILIGAAIVAMLVSALVPVWRRARGGQAAGPERGILWPLRLGLVFLLFNALYSVLGLPEQANRIATGASGIMLALAIMWGGWLLIDMTTATTTRLLGVRAGATDEILVSLLQGAAKLVLLAGGLLYIAHALSLPYESVLAGLGIGGLAVAFASKETISNVFGAGILAADRPFRRGDWIEAGEAKGTVENVGIRSTRIRTADDSLLVIPNGKLADATVNNLGTRRHRGAKAQLVLGRSTDPDLLTKLLRDLEALMDKIPHYQPGSAQIGVSAIGLDGITVDIACRLDVRSAADEREGKTRLMLEVLRLAHRLRIPLTEPAAAAAA